jgi:hypothetical protein
MSERPITPRNQGDYDAPHVTPVTAAEDVRTMMINRVSWSAVLAGVVIALVVQLLLNMLGIGIGAATVTPATGDIPSVSSFSLGAGIWFAVAGILAALAGGYAAGRLAGAPKESTAGWHGLTAWAVSTLIVFYLLTTAVGGLIGGAYSGMTGLIGGVTSVAGSTTQTAVQAAAPNLPRITDPFTSIEQSIRSASGGNDPGAVRDAAIAAVRGALTGDAQKVQEARERAAQTLAKAQNISIDDARTQVEQYEKQYRQTINEAKEQAAQAADAAATAVSRAALLGAISLMLGALAAWFGGSMGAVEPTITARGLASRATRVARG